MGRKKAEDGLTVTPAEKIKKLGAKNANLAAAKRVRKGQNIPHAALLYHYAENEASGAKNQNVVKRGNLI